MDRQRSTQTIPADPIPVNTRTIGTPEGIYILYLEDYVHTFIKKIIAEANPQGMAAEEECRTAGERQLSLALYGQSVEENGRYRLVISGVAVLDSDGRGIQQINDFYFPSWTYIGTACPVRNKDARLRLELAIDNMKVIVDDFYIFYDQNEEMQNYLIEWNTDKERRKERISLSAAEARPRARDSASDAARLGRIAQAYNREEAKVSFMWNIMNILCLGFVVCVMAYGIISINNYNKMRNMQASIDYCMAFITENAALLLPDAPAAETMLQENPSVSVSAVEAQPETQPVSAPAVDTPQQTPPVSAPAMEAQQQAQPATDAAQEEGTAQDGLQTQQQAHPGSQGGPPVEPQPAADSGGKPATAQPRQYYVVRQGDTLRAICLAIYGSDSRLEEICLLNNIQDPNNILYGQKLLLP